MPAKIGMARIKLNCILKHLIVACVFVGLLLSNARGQCPTASFGLPDTVCAGVDLPLSNLSTGATNYEWDFCAGDLAQTPTIMDLGTMNGAFTNPFSISIVTDSVNWYGFVKNSPLSAVRRLNFGNSLANIPTVDTVTLGGPSTGLNFNSFGKIRFVKENGLWYGMAVSDISKIYRFEFGSSLTTDTVNVITLANTGLLSSPKDMDVVIDNDSVLLFVVNSPTNNITRIKLGTSITNDPISANNITVIQDSGFVVGSNAIKIEKDCDNWVGFVVGTTSSTMARLNFGNSLNTNPTADLIAGSFPAPQVVELINENANWYGFIKVFNAASFVRVDFGSSLLNTPISLTTHSAFSSMIGFSSRAFSLNRDGSKWYAHAMNQSNKRLYKLTFPDSCSATPTVETGTTPANVSYSTTGRYNIAIKSCDANNNCHYFADSVIVRGSPTVDFSFTNTCDGDSTFFADISPDTLVNWQWNFGDGNSNTVPNPHHLYMDTGNYQVTLVGINADGCADSTTYTTGVNSNPVASFTVDTTCGGVDLNLVNNSTVVNDSIVSWRWQFGNGDSAFTMLPNYAYDTFGVFLVELHATSSNGCADSVVNSILVEEAPVANWDVTSTCLNDTAVFANLSTFSGNFTSFWEFGDGNTQSGFSPTYVYPDSGNYPAKLVVTADNGCLDSLEQPIRISIPPVVDFTSSAPACRFAPVTFTDMSITFNDTLKAWDWSFGDSLPTSFNTFLLSGLQPVGLTVTAGQDCQASDTAMVNILEGPVAIFNYDRVCVGDQTLFSNNSFVPGGQSIIAYNWNFGDNSGSTLPSPTHAYNDTVNYTVSFTITTDSGCVSNLLDTLEASLKPTAALFSAPPYCSDVPTGFANLSSSAPNDPITASLWTFTNTSTSAQDTSTTFSPFNNFTVPGTYDIELMVSTGALCMDTTGTTIIVGESPNIQFTADTSCLGSGTQFTDNYSGSNFDWQWNFGDGQQSAADDPNHTYDTIGIYPVQVTITHSSSTCFDTASGIAAVYANPVAHFSADNICAGIPYQLNDSSFTIEPLDSVTSWNWEVFSIDTVNLRNPTLTFPDSTLYSIGLEVSTQNGCTDKLIREITVRSLPRADFDFTPSFGAAPLPVDFLSTSDRAVNFSWNFGDNATSTGAATTHTYASTGDYTITLIAFSEYGCPDTLRQILGVRNPILDIAIVRLEAIRSDNFYGLRADLINRGTRDITSVEILAEISNGSTIREIWTGLLKPGELTSYEFNASFELQDGIVPEFACAELSLPNGEPDDFPANNRACILGQSELLLNTPFPNPIEDLATIRFIIPRSGQVQLLLFDPAGRVASELYSGQTDEGLMEIDINFSQFSAGVYTVALVFEDEVITQKAIKR